ncbi:beta strand repeat-containing protein [Tabrizicola sp.]|uniref:beta strand repeat-containing protein n=1 Tax=Tabrizicola sp. TaxID=2005166 RepID=UPI003D27ADA0
MRVGKHLFKLVFLNWFRMFFVSALLAFPSASGAQTSEVAISFVDAGYGPFTTTNLQDLENPLSLKAAGFSNIEFLQNTTSGKFEVIKGLCGSQGNDVEVTVRLTPADGVILNPTTNALDANGRLSFIACINWLDQPVGKVAGFGFMLPLITPSFVIDFDNRDDLTFSRTAATTGTNFFADLPGNPVYTFNGVNDVKGSANLKDTAIVTELNKLLPDTPGIEGVKTVAITSDTGVVGLSVGDTLTYTIAITNTGSVSLTGVAVQSDTLSRGTGTSLTAISGFTAANFTTTGSTTLAPGASVSYTATYIVTQADIDAGGLSNTATVVGTPPSGPAVTDITDNGDDTDNNFFDDATTLTVAASPAMTVTKTADITGFSNPVKVGDEIVYTITVENTGNVSLTTVLLDDPLTADEAYVSGDEGTADTMEVGEVWTYSATYALTQADIDAGKVENIAVATATPPSGTAFDVESSATGNGTPGDGEGTPTAVTLTASPAIEGVKTVAITNDKGAKGLSVGDELTYTIAITNTGNVSLTGVAVQSDTLSRGTGTSLTAISGFTAASFTTTDSKTLAPGASVSYTATYVVTQADIDAGGLSNTATVVGTPPSGSAVTDVTDNGNDNDGNTTGDATTLTVAASPSIEGVKTVAITNDKGAKGLSVGDELTYTIAITNTGNVSLTGVAVQSDTLSRGTGTSLTAISGFTAASFTTTDSKTLAPGASVSYTATYVVTQADIDAGGLSNTATVVGTPPSGSVVTDVTDNGNDNDGNTTGDATTLTVAAAPEFTIEKVVDANALDDGFQAGDKLEYTITVKNTGNVTLSAVKLTDTPTDGNGDLLSLDAIPAKVSDTDGVGTDDIMDVGDIWIYKASITLTKEILATGNVKNVANVEGKSPLREQPDVFAESTIDGNTDPEGSPTETGFKGQIEGTVRSYLAGVQGVEVYLLKEVSPGVYERVPGENGDVKVITGPDGSYTFANLAPGVYGVEFVDPKGSNPLASSADNSEEDNRIIGIPVSSGSVEIEQDAVDFHPELSRLGA